MVVEKSTDRHRFFLSLREALHFMDHFLREFSNYVPNRICAGLRGFLGHGTLNAKPRKGPGKLGQLVTQAPGTQQEMGGLQSRIPTLVLTNNHSFSIFISFIY